MRLALISDLHGNEVALDAVLADARKVGYDQLVCLGDVATLGPRPSEVLAKLRSLGCECLLGNHDEFMLEPTKVQEYSSIPALTASIHTTRSALSSAEIDFIRSFRPTLTVGSVLLFHGTPRSNVEDLLSTTPDAKVDEMLAGHEARVFAGGHTHLPMVRQHRGTLIVNGGSVGVPFREYASHGPPVILARAEYAIVDVDGGDVGVTLRCVEPDRRALRAQAEAWDDPLAASLRAAYG